MSRLRLFRDQSGPFEPASPAPDRVVAGAPAGEARDVYADGTLFSGTWTSSPGAWRVAYDEWEFCQIIEGRGRLIPDGAEPVEIAAGDAFVIEPGFTGIWEVQEPMRKTYVIRLAPGGEASEPSG